MLRTVSASKTILQCMRQIRAYGASVQSLLGKVETLEIAMDGSEEGKDRSKGERQRERQVMHVNWLPKLTS